MVTCAGNANYAEAGTRDQVRSLMFHLFLFPCNELAIVVLRYSSEQDEEPVAKVKSTAMMMTLVVPKL